MSSKKSSKGEKLKNEKKLEEPSSLGKYFIVFLVLGGLTAYSAYKYLSTPLEKPVLDLEQWWGPYPIDLKKDVSIRPYQIEFSDVIVNDLRERLLHSRPLTPPLEDVGFNYGFNTNYLTKVLDYWKNNYNFKEREQFLNKYKHFITNIQGLDIHYMHVKPKVSANVTVVPILLIHGWPGSIREFYEIIPKLTTVRPDQKFVFEVIAPSIPGFGFSQVRKYFLRFRTQETKHNPDT
ncbi:juvenile hormone epoxide hydrolase-like [Trichoplusia ni]|uniref:Juvenile hormone epoxide hydrolase-like n=1 Tax=Trichoplusia ni TaxID=7111 RepID=A0A7E5W5D4_TRINI|nr:juvenile hormone epoxide hydrolase-like [Trichoplusia ni]XP_026735692.1 juvenile hormone epoxide hydrolase-like [Trichoplusia ni]